MERGTRVRAALGDAGRAPGVREVLLWLAGGMLLATAMTWPLLARLTTHVPQDAADPLAEAWEVAWGGHALRTQLLDPFRANAFWPEGPSLAFSDSLLGYAPAALVGEGFTAVVVRYNLLFLFAYALAFAGAAVLARELRLHPLAAAVAGAAFAYAPWRLAHNGHLNVLSIGGIPLAVALLVGGFRRDRPARIVAGFAVAAWQVSLGFGLGIYFCYALLVLAAAAAAAWWWRGRPALPRRTVVAGAAGAALFLAVTAAFAMPYLGVLDRYPDAARGREYVELFSPPARGLLAAPAESRVWGEATAQTRARLPWPPEQTLFPGLTLLVLAGIGLVAGRWPRPVRAGLAVTAVATAVLSLGTNAPAAEWTYLLLHEHAPGFEGLRTPGRLTLFTTLALALLAAAGTEALARSAGRWAEAGGHRRDGAPSGAGTAAALALAASVLVLAEGSTTLRLAEVPPPPAGLAGLPDPQYHLPAGVFPDMRYMFWSAATGFPRIGNGNTSFLPPRLDRLRSEVTSFPDAGSVAALRELGFRVVVLHPAWTRGTPWEGAADRDVSGLGITRERRGDVVVYDLSRPRHPS